MVAFWNQNAHFISGFANPTISQRPKPGSRLLRLLFVRRCSFVSLDLALLLSWLRSRGELRCGWATCRTFSMGFSKANSGSTKRLDVALPTFVGASCWGAIQG